MLPQKTFLTKQYTITDDFFCDGVLQISQIMKCLEDVSKQHAESLGFGFQAMQRLGLLWMISKAKLHFVRPITPQTQSLIITTWPIKNRRSFCNRYFVATDQSGVELFSAVYLWVGVDKDARTIATASQMEQIYNCDFDTAIAEIDTDFAKFVLDQTFEKGDLVVMQKQHLDENDHVNNVNYVAFATSGEKATISKLQITFHHETLLGQSLQLYYKVNRDEKQVCGVKADGNVSFTARYTLKY